MQGRRKRGGRGGLGPPSFLKQEKLPFLIKKAFPLFEINK